MKVIFLVLSSWFAASSPLHLLLLLVILIIIIVCIYYYVLIYTYTIMYFTVSRPPRALFSSRFLPIKRKFILATVAKCLFMGVLLSINIKEYCLDLLDVETRFYLIYLNFFWFGTILIQILIKLIWNSLFAPEAALSCYWNVSYITLEYWLKLMILKVHISFHLFKSVNRHCDGGGGDKQTQAKGLRSLGRTVPPVCTNAMRISSSVAGWKYLSTFGQWETQPGTNTSSLPMYWK